MNQRIRQLAEQAGLVRRGDWGMKRWEGPRSDSINDQDLEKFAELIVKEFVVVVENLSPGYEDYRNQIEDAFRRDCVMELKHHFGIEE